MKTPSLLLAFLFVFATAQSQTIDETFITGKWKVKKATALKDADKAEFKEYVDGFNKATFTFNADYSFAFETKSPSKIMTQLEKMFNAKNKWIFEKKKIRIKIGKKGDGYSVASFLVRIEKDKIIFHVEETNIELVMKKQ